jgi:hypothetical protein
MGGRPAVPVLRVAVLRVAVLRVAVLRVAVLRVAVAARPESRLRWPGLLTPPS